LNYPSHVALDLSGEHFQLQLGKLKVLYPDLHRQLGIELIKYVGMDWEQFEALVFPKIYEFAFNDSYIVLELHLVQGKVEIVAQLFTDILVLGSIRNPVISI
jgi:hypothetical protein